MGDITKNFSLHEFPCPCCGRNDVTARLVVGLQRLRDILQVPITVTSGFRCRKYNTLIKGAAESQHMSGRAADVVVPGLTEDEVGDAGEQVPVFRDGGIGVYPCRHVHLDVRIGRVRWRTV